VQVCKQLHHGQPESRALELARQSAVDLTERFEQQVQPFRRDAHPAIGDGDLQEVRELAVGQREGPAHARFGQLANF